MRMRGFTLVEVTVAIFIVAVMLLLLVAVIHSSTLVRISSNQGTALAIVRNKAESLRIAGYNSIPASGPFFDSLLATMPAFATTTFSVSAYNAKTKQVTVGVTWRDPGAAASTTVSLSTLVTQTGGLP